LLFPFEFIQFHYRPRATPLALYGNTRFPKPDGVAVCVTRDKRGIESKNANPKIDLSACSEWRARDDDFGHWIDVIHLPWIGECEQSLSAAAWRGCLDPWRQLCHPKPAAHQSLRSGCNSASAAVGRSRWLGPQCANFLPYSPWLRPMAASLADELELLALSCRWPESEAVLRRKNANFKSCRSHSWTWFLDWAAAIQL